ncbi:MAG: alpha/beta hydrolase [Acidimicrobiia bacterium]
MATAEPHSEGIITLRDGRRLAHAEFGDPSGRSVVLLHGNPGSRLICPDEQATADAGIRLITYDRPGVGRSDPSLFHDLNEVADDFAELSAALGLGPVPIIGWSDGGPVALAIAARHRNLVESVALVSGSGLADDPDVMSQRTEEVEDLIARLRERDSEALATVESGFAFYADDPTAIVQRTTTDEGDPDAAVMARGEVRAAFNVMLEEGARQGARGLTDGWAAVWALARGYDPSAIETPVSLWHGTHDVLVPVQEAERLAAVLPKARLTLFEGEGHFIAVDHWAEILAGL